MNGQGFLRFEPRVGGFGFGASGFLKACLRFAGVRDVQPQSYGFFSGFRDCKVVDCGLFTVEARKLEHHYPHVLKARFILNPCSNFLGFTVEASQVQSL